MTTWHVEAGDLEAGAGEALLKRSGPVDLIWTDPPWNPPFLRRFRRWAGVGEGLGWEGFVARFARLLAGVGAPAYVYLGQRFASDFRVALAGAGLTQRGEWMVTYSGRPAVLAAFAPEASYWLPCRELQGGMGEFEAMRLTMTPYAGGLVFDPCTGRGSIAMTALSSGCRFVGLELRRPVMVELKAALERRWPQVAA